MIMKFAQDNYMTRLIENEVNDKLVKEMLPQEMNDNGQIVYDYLSQNYPSDTLEWVKNTDWKKTQVPLKNIQMARRPGGAREVDKVKGISQAIKAGEPMEAVVLVKVPGKDKMKIADGYHRTLGFEHAGKDTIEAWVGTVKGEKGPWDKEMHERKLNVGKQALEEFLEFRKEAALPAVLGRGLLSLGKGLTKSTWNAGKSLSGANVVKTQMNKNKVLKNPNATPESVKAAKRDARKAGLGMAGSWGALGTAGLAGSAMENYNQKRNETYETAISDNKKYDGFRTTLNP